jgi:integrase
MGTVYKKTSTRVLPANAKVTTKRRGATPKELRAEPGKANVVESIASWVDRTGEKRTGVVVIAADGSQRVRTKSETYFAKYRDGSGIVRDVPTGCRDKQAAKSILADLESQAEKIRSGIITQQDTKTAKHAKRPVADHIADYCDYLTQEGKHPDRIKTTRKRLLEVGDACDFRLLSDLNADRFLKWLSSELHKDRSLATLNQYIGMAIAWGFWLTGKRIHNKKTNTLGEKRIETNPFAGVGKYNESDDPRRQRRALNEDELNRLLFVARWRPIAEFGRATVAKVGDELPESSQSRKTWSLERLTFEGVRNAVDIAKAKLEGNPTFLEELDRRGFERYLIYKLAVLTGLRRGEIESLTFDHLHFTGAMAFVSMKAKDTKNREAIDIPLRADIADELRQWLDIKNRSRVAGSLRSESRVAGSEKLFSVPRSLIRCLDRDLAAAEIAKVDDRGRTVDVHALRHTFGTLLSKGGVAPRTAQQAMRHSDIRLTMKTYTDPRLLDVAGAVEALPLLELESITATTSLKRTGTDNAFTVASSVAPMVAPTTVKTGQNRSFWDNSEPATTSDENTKKPLNSQGKQGFILNRAGGIRTHDLYHPKETNHPKPTNKNKGKRNTQGDGCTNGCTCERCLAELANTLRSRLTDDERRKLAVLLLN